MCCNICQIVIKIAASLFLPLARSVLFNFLLQCLHHRSSSLEVVDWGLQHSSRHLALDMTDRPTMDKQSTGALFNSKDILLENKKE